jgi:hypothetical protein
MIFPSFSMAVPPIFFAEKIVEYMKNWGNSSNTQDQGTDVNSFLSVAKSTATGFQNLSTAGLIVAGVAAYYILIKKGKVI